MSTHWIIYKEEKVINQWYVWSRRMGGAAGSGSRFEAFYKSLPFGSFVYVRSSQLYNIETMEF